jgi:two-component system response regulator NreC
LDFVAPLKILVVDDYAVVRCGVRALVESEPGWTVCAEARDGQSAIDKAVELLPDVIVMDLVMPGLGGTEATRRIVSELHLPTKVLVHSANESHASVREALSAGARGYVLKRDPARELVEGIRHVSQGQQFFSASVADVVIAGNARAGDPQDRARPVAIPALTPREREVLLLLAEGKRNDDVAQILGISTKTAESHRRNVMEKLKMRSVADLVRYAIRQHWIEP